MSVGVAISENPTGRGNWIQTLNGGQFYPMDPRPEDINIEDIAGSLARQCRFGGNCLQPYSVAEHCVHVARAAPRELQLTALLHDASEAYLVDVPRPVKQLLEGYVDIEYNIMRVISEKFGTIWPLPEEIRYLDNAILSDERYQNMAKMDISPEIWGNYFPGLYVTLQFWDHQQAEVEFFTDFFYYGGKEG